MTGRLAGKVAVVTGGAMGQGAGISRAYVAEGAKVVIADVAKEEGQALADELGSNAHFFHHDVSDEASWTALVTDTHDRFGLIGILANNAGILRFGTVVEMPASEYELLFRVNQLGPFLGMKAVVPDMKQLGGGAIINASSTEGLGGMSNLVAYCGTKFAVRGMTKGASHELGRSNIRVNSVHPGMLPPMRSSKGSADPQWRDKMIRAVPMRREGRVEEVAHAVLFLASDEASYITGTELVVDGGYLAV